MDTLKNTKPGAEFLSEKFPPASALGPKATPKPRAKAPDGSHYAALGLPKDATEKEINNAFLELQNKHRLDAGGYDEAFAPLRKSWEILATVATRQAYDRFLSEQSAPPARFEITGAIFPFQTNDVREAFRAQLRGMKVKDRRQGEPGGLDAETTARYRIEIPAGRKWAGETRRDSLNTQFINGVAYLNTPDELKLYRELQYIITDRGQFDTLPGATRD
jgi:curved DNA-binding protein CbpA